MSALILDIFDFELDGEFPYQVTNFLFKFVLDNERRFGADARLRTLNKNGLIIEECVWTGHAQLLINVVDFRLMVVISCDSDCLPKGTIERGYELIPNQFRGRPVIRKELDINERFMWLDSLKFANL